MSPTAMATAPLNNNYQYVNMGFQQQQQQQNHHPDEVVASAARAPITRNGISSSAHTNNNNGNKSTRSGAKNKSHKTRTRPQNRHRRSSDSMYALDSLDQAAWQHYNAAADRRPSPETPQAEVAQLSVSRRHSSRGSRLNRVINKTNLGGLRNFDTSKTSNEDDAGAGTNNGNHSNSQSESEVSSRAAVTGRDNGELDSDNEDVGESGQNEGLPTSRQSNIHRGRADWSAGDGISSTTSKTPTAKNPITTTTRRMNVNNDNNSHDEDEEGDVEEEEEDEEFGEDEEEQFDGDDNGVGRRYEEEEAVATSAEQSIDGGLPTFSFLRGEHFNNRSPAVQYDSATINSHTNSNNHATMNRDSGSSSAEMGLASASTTPTAMELECVAGYDGGLPQYFVLEAYDSRTRKLRLNITSAFPDLPVFRIDMEGMYSEKERDGICRITNGQNWTTGYSERRFTDLGFFITIDKPTRSG